jgi:hypothetical protein
MIYVVFPWRGRKGFVLSSAGFCAAHRCVAADEAVGLGVMSSSPLIYCMNSIQPLSYSTRCVVFQRSMMLRNGHSKDLYY